MGKGKRRQSGFNAPFADLEERLKAAAAVPQAAAPQAAAPPALPAPGRPQAQPSAQATPPAAAPGARPRAANADADLDTDARLFADEMASVSPLGPDPRGRRGTPDKQPPLPARSRARDDAEAYAELADLVAGHGPFDITATDEYVEALAPGVDRRLLRKLKQGDYALEGHVDLHGLRRDEARDEVVRYLAEARDAGKRCVLIVHGRGLNSKDNVPVLKSLLVSWLQRGSIGAGVLAFCTARPSDGGAGAVYVLLRR